MIFPVDFHVHYNLESDFQRELNQLLEICKLEKYQETESVCEKNAFRTGNLLNWPIGVSLLERLCFHLFNLSNNTNENINKFALNCKPYWFHIIEYGEEGYELPNKNENESFCLIIPLNKSSKQVVVSKSSSSDLVFALNRLDNFFLYSGKYVRKVINPSDKKDIAKIAFISFVFSKEKAQENIVLKAEAKKIFDEKTQMIKDRKNILKRFLNKIFSIWA